MWRWEGETKGEEPISVLDVPGHLHLWKEVVLCPGLTSGEEVRDFFFFNIIT